jgi:hypothetical protein
MKKINLAFLLIASFGICSAQVTVPKTVPSTKDFIKPPAIGDVGKTTTGIVDDLTSKLSLPAAQKPKLTDVISGFLTKKKDITGLADTNPTSYLSKFNPLQKGLFDKLKGIMGASAFTKFLGLKPSGSGAAGNLLSNLFF